MNQPPMNGPIRKLKPATAPIAPWYFARSRGLKRSPTDGDRDWVEAAGPQTLKSSKADQLVHGLGGTRQQGAGGEQTDRQQQHHLAAVDIGQLSLEGNRHRRTQHVGRHYPDEAIRPQQVGHDPRECRGNLCGAENPSELSGGTHRPATISRRPCSSSSSTPASGSSSTSPSHRSATAPLIRPSCWCCATRSASSSAR